MKKYLLFAILITSLFTQTAYAKTILYVPQDNRPVSFDYVVDTAKAAGIEVITPQSALIAGRNNPGNPDYLWNWVLSHCNDVDAMVISADALIYGGLVASRTHHYPEAVLKERLARFERLKQINPGAGVYVYSTIMRTPKASAGGTEPDYYEQYGPAIFQITALKDKKELASLSRGEEQLLRNLEAAVPKEAMADWYDRRGKNYKTNVGLVSYIKDGTFDYLIQGRDDCSPYSQSHMESRMLTKETKNLLASKYASFPGADQLGMLLVARATNALSNHVPVVSIIYAPGAGEKTVPSYEDKEIAQTVTAQVSSAGGVVLPTPLRPDLILAIDTPENGITLEASSAANREKSRPSVTAFISSLQEALAAKKQVSVAAIAFSNGADNALMHEMTQRGLVPQLAAFSGWNTAGNTIGYAISQGMLARTMRPEAKNRLLAVRLLDDWVYQSNIRSEVAETVLWPLGGNYFCLDDLSDRLVLETEQRMQKFVTANIKDLPTDNFTINFPWNRMFEVSVKLQEPQVQ